ncbi:MAG: hypothetical protein ACOCVF_04035 [bacterium]
MKSVEEIREVLLQLYDERKQTQVKLQQLNEKIYLTEEMLMYRSNRDSE